MKIFLNDLQSKNENDRRTRPTIPFATFTVFEICSANISSESIVTSRTFPSNKSSISSL